MLKGGPGGLRSFTERRRTIPLIARGLLEATEADSLKREGPFQHTEQGHRDAGEERSVPHRPGEMAIRTRESIFRAYEVVVDHWSGPPTATGGPSTTTPTACQPHLRLGGPCVCRKPPLPPRNRALGNLRFQTMLLAFRCFECMYRSLGPIIDYFHDRRASSNGVNTSAHRLVTAACLTWAGTASPLYRNNVKKGLCRPPY